jgi:hypothetical protein
MLEWSMHKVVARIREGSNTMNANGTITDEYEKIIELPFPPFIGLVIDELTHHSSIIYVSYSLEASSFTVILEDIGDRNTGSSWLFFASDMKMMLIDGGWSRTFKDE